MHNRKYTIVIPNYNSEKTIIKCLDAVLNIDEKERTEVIICDNMSTDNCLDLIKEYQINLITNNSIQTAGYTRNLGAINAKNDYLIFIDSDVVTRKDLISKIDKEFSSKDISCITGIFSVYNPYSDFFSQYKTLYANYKFLLATKNVLNSGIMAIKKSVFFDVGMFDDKLLHSEDDQLSLKLTEKKYNIYLKKDLLVDHYKQFNFFNLIKNDFVKTFTLTNIFLSNLFQKKESSSIKDFIQLYLQGILNITIIFLIMFFIFVYLLNLNIKLLLAIVMMIIFYIFNNFKFFKFVFGHKGFMFSFKTILFNPFNFLVVSTASFMSCLNFILFKFFKKNNNKISTS